MMTDPRTVNRPPRQTSNEQAQADKLAALHERLAAEVAALRTGEDWQRWLAVAARFHSYSFQNTLLILSQRPDQRTSLATRPGGPWDVRSAQDRRASPSSHQCCAGPVPTTTPLTALAARA